MNNADVTRTATASETDHFTITGEALTELARNGMLDDRPGWAYRLLAEGLMGDGARDVAVAVLDGKKKLVGTREINVADDRSTAAKKYLKDLHYVYAGRIKVGGQWWRPYALIHGFGEDDAHYANDTYGAMPTRMSPGFKTWALKRVEFYVGEPCPLALLDTEHGGHSVVWERCNERPQWWPEFNRPEDALADFVAAGHSFMKTGAFPDARPSYGQDQRSAEQASEIDAASIRSAAERRAQAEAPTWMEVHHGISAAEAAELNGPAAVALHPPGAAQRAREARAARVEKYTQELTHAFTTAVKALTPDEVEEAEEKARHAEFLKELVFIGTKVRAQAGDDTFVLECEGGRALKVPRAPFWHWALQRTKMRHLAPPWQLVSKPGLKTCGDDPYHTDWLLGAGCSPKDAYDGPVKEASWHELFELQRRIGNLECAVVVDGGDVVGKIGEEVVVVPDLSPEHLPAMAKARGIITERGGQLAHLAVVGRERGLTIMRCEDARERYREGMTVELRPSEGKIVVSMLELTELEPDEASS